MAQTFFKKLVSLSHGSDFSLKFYEREPMTQISMKNISELEPWLKNLQQYSLSHGSKFGLRLGLKAHKWLAKNVNSILRTV